MISHEVVSKVTSIAFLVPAIEAVVSQAVATAILFHAVPVHRIAYTSLLESRVINASSSLPVRLANSICRGRPVVGISILVGPVQLVPFQT